MYSAFLGDHKLARTTIAIFVLLTLCVLGSKQQLFAAEISDATVRAQSVGLHSGSDWDYHVVGKVYRGQAVHVAARSADAKWLLVEAESVKGWASTSYFNVSGQLAEFPVSTATLPNAIQKPTVTVTQPRLGMHSGAAWGYNVIGTLYEDQEVIVNATSPDHSWVFIWSDNGDGWVPMSGVRANADLSQLPTWTAPIEGAQLKPTAHVTRAHLGIHTGAAMAYNVIGSLEQGDEIIIMATNPNHSWLFIWSDDGDGWVPMSGVTTSADLSALPVWTSTMSGAIYKPTAMIAQQRLGLHSGAGFGYNVVGMVYANEEVIMMGRNATGDWVFIWSDAGDGWVPTVAINPVTDVMNLQIWTTEMEGAVLKPTAQVMGAPVSIHTCAEWQCNTFAVLQPNETPILMARSADNAWVFVWSNAGDGWAPASALQINIAMSELAVWQPNANAARTAATGTINWANAPLRANAGESGMMYAALGSGNEVTLLGRDASGNWAYVASAMGDGWVNALAMGDSAEMYAVPVMR